tara:strand:+ start:28190 stop:28390 length:201 start_codon:yes stop_codon:yes gene_type:complete
MMQLPNKNLFTPGEVADIFFGPKDSKDFVNKRAKVLRMLNKKQIPGQKIGDNWYITLETLKRMLDE